MLASNFLVLFLRDRGRPCLLRSWELFIVRLSPSLPLVGSVYTLLRGPESDIVAADNWEENADIRELPLEVCVFCCSSIFLLSL